MRRYHHQGSKRAEVVSSLLLRNYKIPAFYILFPGSRSTHYTSEMEKLLEHRSALRSISVAENILIDGSETVENSQSRGPFPGDFQIFSPPDTAKRNGPPSRNIVSHSLDEPDASPSKSRTEIRLRRRSSTRRTSNDPQPTASKKRKICREEYEDDYEKEEETYQQRKASVGKRMENELLNLVKEWIDPLLDLTMDSPQRITKNMLELRMCMEKTLKRDELTTNDEKMLRGAIEKLRDVAKDMKREI
jgi:hypothetical protein